MRAFHAVMVLLASAVVTWSCNREAPTRAGAEEDAARPEPTAVLYGRVLASDHAAQVPAEWGVRVSAEYEDGLDVSPRDRDSTGDLFAFKVVPGKRVRLYFEAVPYQSATTDFIDVTSDRTYAFRLHDVVMDRIRWTMALFASGNGDAFARNLQAEAAVAERTGSADIFRANLEYYRKASAKFPDCLRKLQEFERSPRGVELTRKAEARGVPLTALASLVMDPAELARRDPDTLRKLSSDPRIARSLRAEARRALEGPSAAPPARPTRTTGPGAPR